MIARSFTLENRLATVISNSLCSQHQSAGGGVLSEPGIRPSVCRSHKTVQIRAMVEH